MFQRPIFRKKSFDQLSSPEKFDELLQVTSSKSWLILVSLILVIFMILTWAFLGTITYKADGPGIFNQPNEEIIALHTGQIDTIFVRTGDYVHKGQLVAKIIPEEALQRIGNYYAGIYLIEKEANEGISGKTDEIKTKLNKYLREIENQCLLTSPLEGIIAEIKAEQGTFVQDHSPLFSIQRWENDSSPSVIFFLPEADISKIKIGLEVLVNTSDSRNSIQFSGKIFEVPRFPASSDRLMRVFQNETFLHRLLETDFYEFEARIYPPPGFTIQDLNRNSGKYCHAEVIIDQKRPISLLFNR